jgi:hypothetical protein
MNIACAIRPSMLLIGLVAGGILASALCPKAVAQGPMRQGSAPMGPVLVDGKPLSYSNWVSFGMAQPFIGGDRGHFAQRHRLPGTLSGGFEDLYIERFVGDNGLLSLDGRALYENRDYRLRLSLTDPAIGFARVGFRQFRTWYDGSGGFFPLTDRFFSPLTDDMGMDRGEAWVEGGMTAARLPRVTLRYTRQFRSGQKPSLVWGDADMGSGLGLRSTVPAFWQTDEVRNVFEGNVRHGLGPNNLEIGIRYERGDLQNVRNMNRRPEEPVNRVIAHHEGDRNSLFHVHAIGDSRLHRGVRLTTSYSFTSLDGELVGSRVFGAGIDPVYDPVFDRRQARDVGYINLNGTTTLRQHTAGANLMVSPWKQLTIVPSLRLERQSTRGLLDYVETYVQPGQGLLTTETPKQALNERNVVDLIGSLDARFTGVRNMTLYLRGNWLKGTGDLSENEILSLSGAASLDRESHDTRYTDKYVVGANWYPLRGLNVAAQAYRKRRITDFEHPESPRGLARYPAFLITQDFTTDDVNFRVRWRLMPGLSMTSRVDYQWTTIGASPTELEYIESGQIESRIISQSLTWLPTGRLHVQASLNHVTDRQRTPLNGEGDMSEQIVPRDRNDYINAFLATTFALAERIDVEGQYFLYLAENYIDNSAVSVPFGTGCAEHGLAAGLAWQVQAGLRLSARYVYFNHQDQTSGGHNNYDSHLLFTGLQYRF